jgi:uncharacterized membrane protein
MKHRDRDHGPRHDQGHEAHGHDGHTHRRRPGLWGNLRNSFLTGLIVIAPISLTLYLIWWTAGVIDGRVLPLVPRAYQPSTYLGFDIRGYGVMIFLIFTVLVGWAAKGLIGRSLIHWSERVVDRLPVIRSIYNGFKQIVETVLSQGEQNFEKACLVEYPRKGIWAIAFISSSAKGEIASKHGPEPMVSVFLPTTPNPTSGFLLFIPVKDVIVLDMTVEDAAKLIISAGLVYPNPKDPTKPPEILAEAPPRQAAE